MKIYPPQSSYNYLGKGDGKNSRCIPEMGFPGGSVVKNPPANAGDPGSTLGWFPWRRKWQPTLVFLLGESHGQRSLAGYSPRGHKESDTIEATEQQFQKYFALLFPHNEVSSGGEECHSHEEVWGRVEEQL